MRILQLHSNFIQYKLIEKEIDLAEEAEKREERLEELLVLFTAVEEEDDDTVAKKAVIEVKDFLEKLNVDRILIYPYAHLSNNLAKPRRALELVQFMEDYCRKIGLEAYRAPFGWNKQFTISIKGHPLAEQLRVISSGQAEEKDSAKVSKAVKAEEGLESYWYVLQPNGEMVAIEESTFREHENLEKFTRYEMSKVRSSKQMPPHVTLMKRLEIADYEPGSDPGNIRWYPKGRLVKSLLEEYVTTKVIEYGAMEVETPIMYNFQHPSLADYLNRFPARQYLIESEDKELFLRFSACFGQFLMVHDAQFSYKQMPLKIYELTHYSFRREQRGEVVGLRRLRAFTMPDCHAFATDMNQAKLEFIKRLNLCMEILREIGFSEDDYEAALRFTKDFYNENQDFIKSLAQIFGRPVLIEMWEKRFFYFILKWDFNFVDNQNKAAALSTDQIDVENAERYGITYIDEEGEKHNPLILHCSPSGAIERCVYALLEKAYKEQQSGKPPMLPLWLSPSQVRFVPMSDEYFEHCRKLADALEAQQVRVDIDDRPFTMQKRIREAEKEWVPYIIVVGQREIESDVLPVRDRKAGKIRKIQLEELVEEIKKKIVGKPLKPLPMPRNLSMRPQFYG